MQSVYLVSALLIFAADPEPKTSTESVVAKTRTVDDLTVKDLTLLVDRMTPGGVFFSEDAKSFYLIDKKNVLHCVNFAELKEEVRLEVGKPCKAMSLSGEGIVLIVGDEVWVVDPKTLAVKKKIAAPKLQSIAAHPKLSFAYAGKDEGFKIAALDLKAGTVAKEYEMKNFDDKAHASCRIPLISPDGKLLYTVGVTEALQRFAIEGAAIKFEEASPRIAQGKVEGITLSADGKRICVASGAGNYQLDRLDTTPPGVYIFAANSLTAPETKFKPAGRGVAVAFDSKAGLIYTANPQKQLIVCDEKGDVKKEYQCAPGGDGVRQFLIHPDGRKGIVLGDKSVWYFELPKP